MEEQVLMGTYLPLYWEALGLGAGADCSVKRGRLRQAEEVRGPGQVLGSSYAKSYVSVAARGLTREWDWRARWGLQEAGGKVAVEGPETGHLVPLSGSQGKVEA